MNERIKQLLDQAQELAREEVKSTPEFEKYAPSYTIPGTEIHVGIRLSYEKFAELIVRECVAICQDIDGEDNTDARSGRQDCAVEIREHFGVEE